MTIPAVEGPLAGRYESAMTYDDVGQVTSITQPGVGGLPAETLEQGYDDFGLPVSLVGLETYVAWTGYGKLGEVAEHVLGGVDGKRLQQSFEYEDGTRRLAVSRTRQETAGTPTVERRSDYDPAGNLKKLVTAARDLPVDTRCYGIDHLQRLTEAWTATDDCAAPPDTSRLGGPAPYWHSYTYDRVGNRLTETWHASAGDTTRRYTYPAAGSPQPHALQSVTSTGPHGSRTDTFGYDSDGNTTTRKVGDVDQSLAWDIEGPLESISAAGETTSYLYDAAGNRLIRREPGATTLCVAGTELRLDTASGAVGGTRRYLFHGGTVAIRTAAGLSWLSADHHGTGETVIAADSRRVVHRLHLPFGAPRGGVPDAWPGEQGFVGGTKDASTGLTHLGAREYDPLTGRFVSVDPVIDIDDPQQMHGYAYGNNNPATFSDPDGLKAKKKAKKKTPKATPCRSERNCETEAKIKEKKKKKATPGDGKKPKGVGAMIAGLAKAFDAAGNIMGGALGAPDAMLKNAEKKFKKWLAGVMKDKDLSAEWKSCLKNYGKKELDKFRKGLSPWAKSFKPVAKALPPVGAAVDFAGNMAEGDPWGKAATKAAGSAMLGWGAAAAGCALGAAASGPGAPVGCLVGGLLAVAAGMAWEGYVDAIWDLGRAGSGRRPPGRRPEPLCGPGSGERR